MKAKDLNKRLRELREGKILKERIVKVCFKADGSFYDSIARLRDILEERVINFPIGGQGNSHGAEYISPKCLSKSDGKAAIQKEIERAVEVEDYERAAALKKLL